MSRNETVIAGIIILLISSFIELLYGSHVLGFFLLSALMFLLVAISKSKKKVEKNYFLVFFGLAVLLFVFAYNLTVKNGSWGNLDVMTMLFGISLILVNFNRTHTIAKFTLYMSMFFIVSFLSLYSIPHALGIPLPYYYGHYMIAVPVVEILRNVGYDVQLTSLRVITVNGVQTLALKIELSCFGWYSLLLALGTVISYSKTIKRIEKSRLIKILVVTSVAVYLANLLRILILVVVAHNYGLKTMLIFHAHIGWILFTAILIPLIYFVSK